MDIIKTNIIKLLFQSVKNKIFSYTSYSIILKKNFFSFSFLFVFNSLFLMLFLNGNKLFNGISFLFIPKIKEYEKISF